MAMGGLAGGPRGALQRSRDRALGEGGPMGSAHGSPPGRGARRSPAGLDSDWVCVEKTRHWALSWLGHE